MEEEKKLYPFRFCGLEDDYVWGCERFGLADLGYRDSVVKDGWLAGNGMGDIMDMYMDRVVGENVFEYWGRQFPVTVRTLSVKGRMPLRVSPPDELAAQRYDFLGKEKLWYVTRAGKDARIMLGFRKDTDASELFPRCSDSSVEDILNIVAPYAGQFLHIPPGTPHAAAGDMEIVEISESSPLDFCMCAWGKEVSEDEFDPSLGLIDALDFIRYEKFRSDDRCPHHHKEEVVHKLTDLPQFSVSRIELTDAMHIYNEKFESFIIYTCISGAASVQINIFGQTVSYEFASGGTILVPAECPDFYLVPADRSTVLLEITVPHRDDKDAYINPDVPEHTDEEDCDCDCDCGDDDGCESHCHHHS